MGRQPKALLSMHCVRRNGLFHTPAVDYHGKFLTLDVEAELLCSTVATYNQLPFGFLFKVKLNKDPTLNTVIMTGLKTFLNGSETNLSLGYGECFQTSGSPLHTTNLISGPAKHDPEPLKNPNDINYRKTLGDASQRKTWDSSSLHYHKSPSRHLLRRKTTKCNDAK